MTMLLILFATGLLAGTVDAIAGGGGLISLPVLISMGVPAHLAFGTNKLQGVVGTFIAARRYHSQGWISLKNAHRGIAAGLVGAIGGAVAAQIISSDILHKIIPFLLLFILGYTVFSPRIGITDHAPRMHESWFYLVFGFGLGAYDGFFGPGVGSFWVFCLTFFLGYNLLKATAYTKVFNLNTSLVATVCFMVGGNVDYKIALCMAAGQLIGGRLGASLAIKKGARLIRPIFLTMVLLTTTTLMYKSYYSSEIITRITQQYGLLPELLLGGAILLGSVLVYRRTRLNRADEL